MNSAGLFGLFSVITAFLISKTETTNTGIAAFIIGGNEAADGAYPWHLSFQRRVHGWSHACGASLIGDRWALTAAHCVFNRTEKNPDGTYPGYRVADMRVVAGVRQVEPLESDAQIHYLESVLTPVGLHPYFDVALLELKQAVNTNRSDISTIPIANQTEPSSTGNCMITGWGTVDRETVRVHPVLREARTNLLTFRQCLETGWNVAPSQLCGDGTPKGVTACYGDSGGPVTCYRQDGSPVLMGIASFVYGRCRTTRPNVFAKASFYKKWLRIRTGIDDL